MASAVLDTNVVLDWLVFADASVAPLAAAVSQRSLRWLATTTMRAELAHMLGHASLAHWSPDGERALAVFDSLAELRPEPPPSRLHCSDRDDQVFVDLALAAGAGWLVTRDRALLKLARRAVAAGLRIVPPGRWTPE